MRTLNSIGVLLLITTNIYAYQNIDPGFQRDAASTMVLPPVMVEATEFKLMEDNFSFFNINSGMFTVEGESIDLMNGMGQASRGIKIINYPVVQIYRSSTLGNSNSLQTSVFSASYDNRVVTDIYDLIEWNRIREYLENDDYSKPSNHEFKNLIIIRHENKCYAYLVHYVPDNHVSKNRDQANGSVSIKDLVGNNTKTIVLQDGRISISESAGISSHMDIVLVQTKVTTPFDQYLSVQISFTEKEI